MTAAWHLKFGLICLVAAPLVAWVIWSLPLHPVTVIVVTGIVTLAFAVTGASAIIVGLVKLMARRRA